MLTDMTAVRTYFAKLGFEPEIADLYLALHANGPQTISELSRSAHVERTRIYRLIDKLMASNLIEIETHYKRGIVKAAPISNLHILITQKEQEVKNLQDELELIEQVLGRNSLSNPATRVQFYHGVSGIRQMQWNQVTSKTDCLSIIDEPINDVLGKAFTTRWAGALRQNNVHLRMIESPHFVEVIQKWYKRENVPELVPNHESRIIAPKVFRVVHNMDIWENVVAYYNWKDGEIYGIELYNKDNCSKYFGPRQPPRLLSRYLCFNYLVSTRLKHRPTPPAPAYTY